MTTAPVQRGLAAAVRWVRSALREWTGEAEYERYLRHCAARRETPRDRGRYYAERTEEKYRTSSGCC